MWLWDSRTHQFIMSEALFKCKSAFRNMIKLHQELFILGIEAPDRIFKDFTNHYYNCTPNQYGVHSGSIINKIGKEIQLVQAMLNNPNKITVHPGIAPFLSALLDTPLKAFIFELGVLSHYVADLHQPFHTDGKYRFADEETVHKIMEADTRLHLNDFKIELRRRKQIKDPIEYFTYHIYEINGFYDTLIENYFLRKGKVKPDRWQNSFPVIEECLSLAVQNIANVFLSFETAAKIFQHQFRNSKLRKNVINLIDLNKYYKLIKYSSGTISIRRSHVC